MHEPLSYYRHSGKFNPILLLLMLILGCGFGGILGGVYGFLLYKSPYILLSVALLFLGAVILGAMTGYLTQLFKIRSKTFTSLVTPAIGLAALYVSWMCWIYLYTKAVVGDEANVMIFDPRVIWQVVGGLSEVGVWTINDITPSGIWLAGIWGVEALIIIGGAVAGPFVLAFPNPFCELTRCWLDNPEVIEPLELLDAPEAILTEVERGRLDPLLALEKLHYSADTFTRITLRRSPVILDPAKPASLGGGAPDMANATPQEMMAMAAGVGSGAGTGGRHPLHTMSLSLVGKYTDSEGNEQEKTQVLMERFIITPDMYETLLPLGEKSAAELNIPDPPSDDAPA